MGICLGPLDHTAQFSTSIWKDPTQTETPTFRCFNLELDDPPGAGFSFQNLRLLPLEMLCGAQEDQGASSYDTGLQAEPCASVWRNH